MTFDAGLWQDTRRMGGVVCLRGTRIPANQMADYIHEMRVDYGVTLEHLISLYKWDAAGRPELKEGGRNG